MYYTQNIGEEQKDSEYKVFVFNPLKVASDDAIIYLSNGKFVFNNSVIESLKTYLDIYLPKYISSYIHPKSNLKSGTLYIGVEDDGTVSGIPYAGSMPINFINLTIDKIFSKSLKFLIGSTKSEIRSYLQIELIKIGIPTDISKIKKRTEYSKYMEDFEKIKKEHNKYNKKKFVWSNLFDPNNLELCDMINDTETRKIIWTYTKEKTNYSIKAFDNKFSHLEVYCDIYNYWNYMSDMKSNIKFNPLEPKEIIKVKKNKLNPYYWTTEWKDSKMTMLKILKPKIPRKTIDSNYPLFLLSKSNKMIPQWIESNNNLNLYVLKITINIRNPHIIQYKDIENKWKTSYRTLSQIGEPISLTFAT